jgi:hypothetical protein
MGYGCRNMVLVLQRVLELSCGNRSPLGHRSSQDMPGAVLPRIFEGLMNHTERIHKRQGFGRKAR